MGIGGPFPGAKGGRDVTLTTHPTLVPRSRMNRSYIWSPSWCLHGVAGQLYCYLCINQLLVVDWMVANHLLLRDFGSYVMVLMNVCSVTVITLSSNLGLIG
jgi:hypothetical protein